MAFIFIKIHLQNVSLWISKWLIYRNLVQNLPIMSTFTFLNVDQYFLAADNLVIYAISGDTWSGHFNAQ